MEVEFLCLANSRKRGKRCVAGLRTDGSGWVRPVSRIGAGGLSDIECAYEDGATPCVFDVVRVDLAEPRPQPHQPENWIISDRPWKLVRSGSKVDIAELVRPAASTRPGLLGAFKTKVAYDELLLSPKRESLSLIRPESVEWRWEQGSADLKLRVSFLWLGAPYDLPVTDHLWEDGLAGIAAPGAGQVTGAPDADYLFLISLSEPFAPADGDNLFCYTIVACVMTVPVSSGPATRCG